MLADRNFHPHMFLKRLCIDISRFEFTLDRKYSFIWHMIYKIENFYYVRISLSRAERSCQREKKFHNAMSDEYRNSNYTGRRGPISCRFPNWKSLRSKLWSGFSTTTSARVTTTTVTTVATNLTTAMETLTTAASVPTTVMDMLIYRSCVTSTVK